MGQQGVTMACSEMPVVEQSKLASVTRSFIASVIFLSIPPSVILACVGEMRGNARGARMSTTRASALLRITAQHKAELKCRGSEHTSNMLGGDCVVRCLCRRSSTGVSLSSEQRETPWTHKERTSLFGAKTRERELSGKPRETFSRAF